jgi:hypothetical protein
MGHHDTLMPKSPSNIIFGGRWEKVKCLGEDVFTSFRALRFQKLH